METGRPLERNRGQLAGERLARHEVGAAGPTASIPPACGGETACYSPVWSSTSASGAFFLTDSIPFSADALRS
jgi:hypothetical protein